jgi:acyl-CoA synthetase (AMP-forming)/AMP-acid ligase II
MPSFASIAAFVLAAVFAFLVRRHWPLLVYASQYVRMQLSVRLFVFRSHTVADVFASRLAAGPSNTAIVFEGRSISYASLDRLSNRVATWALEVGLKPRDTVALLMENRVEFVAVWLGLSKIGVVTALVNTNLRGAGLAHSLRCCDPRLVVVGRECWEEFAAVRGELGPTMRVWVHSEVSASSSAPPPSAPTPAGALALPPPEDLSAALARLPDLTHDFRPLRVAAGLGSSDLLFYIFTSGTTGLPKAAKIKHLRWALSGASFCNFFGITAADRIYNCLPMYHSAGGMIGLSCAWYSGATLVLRSVGDRATQTDVACARAPAALSVPR